MVGGRRSRLLGDEFDQVTFPELAAPDLVDWVDYKERINAVSPEEFAGRCSLAADAKADAAVAALQKKYDTKLRTLRTRADTATNAAQRAAAQHTAQHGDQLPLQRVRVRMTVGRLRR